MQVKGSPFSRWVRDHYGPGTPDQVAATLAFELRERVHHRGPIGAFDHLLNARRVVEMLPCDIAYDARLRTAEDGFLIEFGVRSSGTQRFATAHELGHTYFYDLDERRPVRLRPREYLQDEEVFCDRFASELLMPEDWLRSNWADRLITMPLEEVSGAIQLLSTEAGVETQSAARRLIHELGLANVVAIGLRWRPEKRAARNDNRGKWIVDWWVSPRSIQDPTGEPDGLGNGVFCATLEFAGMELRPTVGHLREIAPLVASLLGEGLPIRKGSHERNPWHKQEYVVEPISVAPVQLVQSPRGTRRDARYDRTLRESTEMLMIVPFDQDQGF